MFMQNSLISISVQNNLSFFNFVFNRHICIKEAFLNSVSTILCEKVNLGSTSFTLTKSNCTKSKLFANWIVLQEIRLFYEVYKFLTPCYIFGNEFKYLLKIARHEDYVIEVVLFDIVRGSLILCDVAYEQYLVKCPYLFCNICLLRNLVHFRLNTRSDILYLILIVIFNIVCALYAGTLVFSWITALNHYKPRGVSALLAAICFFITTLTVTARCYASKNVKHPLAQLSSEPQFLSSIKNLKFQAYSSKIFLSILFNLPLKYSPGDTSIIIKNSKKLLIHKNFKLEKLKKFKPYVRKKREFNIAKFHLFYRNFVSNNKFNSYNVNTALSTFTLNKQRKNNDTTSTEYSSVRDSSEKTSDTHIYSGNLETEHISKKLITPSKFDVSDNVFNSNAKVSKVSSIFDDINHNDLSWTLAEADKQLAEGFDIDRLMPPALDNSSNSVSNESTALVIVVTAVVLTVALGLVTCVLSHYRGGTAADPHDSGLTTPTTPMLSVVSAGAVAGVGGMDRLRGRGAARELVAPRDHQVRLHMVHTDIEIKFPPNIALPDGEDHPFTNSRLHIRDSEQEAEIYQKCIKPPPNRTVLESESPPPYRSSSAGLLGSIGSCSSGSGDWSAGSAPLVIRCHSMSSTSKRPEVGQKTDFIQRTVKIFTGKKGQASPASNLPVVVVPTRLRQSSDILQNTSSRHKPSV